MTTGFCDRDLPSQCHCIPAAFFLHASCHYLFTAYLFLFQCQFDAQCNLQQTLLKNNVFFRKLFNCLFIPCFKLTPLKNLFYLSSRLRFAATRRCFRTWWVVKVGKFAVIGIGSWCWCGWRRTYKVSKFILPYPTSAIKRKYTTPIVCIFLFQLAHIQYRDIFIFKHFAFTSEMFWGFCTAWNVPYSSEGRVALLSVT